MSKEKIYITKLHHDAKIPSKRDEDAGYDIYACFDEEEFIIEPHATRLVPTGIATKFSKKYVMQLNERGSTGSKGIAQRCGVIDSGFRGEWMVPLTNTTDKKLVITKHVTGFESDENVMFYPYSKAICQALLLPVPQSKIVEVTNEDFEKFESKRGKGMLGSSGK